MTMPTAIMVMLSITLVVVMIPRIYGNWLQFRVYTELGDVDQLTALQFLHNEWVLRHLALAVIALGFVAAITYIPELTEFSQTAVAIAAYSAISFILAFVESLLAQKISSVTAPVR